MKNRLHRYDINRPRPRHRYEYTKYKMCFSIVMAVCTKQHLSNTWSGIHEKVKGHRLSWKKLKNTGWVEKKKKKRCF